MPIRLLCLDHFFGQDLEALRAAGGADVELRTIGYEALRSEALRIFPPEISARLDLLVAPELEEPRRRYARVLEAILEDAWARAPFDAFVVPSDSFFYVRSAREACHRLGVPFLCAQKETTIADHAMGAYARQIGAYAPSRCDHMTVCSERHKAFRVRTGYDASRITVTGQPRFDVYAEDRSPASAGGDPVVLFLSYFHDAYHPERDAGRLGQGIWSRMHHETEQELWALAARGWRVQIKPHPQQDFTAEAPRLRAAAGDAADRLEVIPASADVRHLIRAADVVVGFQTTALLESVIAGVPTAYTGWDPEIKRLGTDMLPFADWGDVLAPVLEAGTLCATVERIAGTPVSEERRAAVRRRVEEHLGPVDGRSSARTLAVLAEQIEALTPRLRTPESIGRQEALRRRRPLHVGLRTRAATRAAKRVVAARLGRA